METYDVIVLGTGAAGMGAAVRAAAEGATVGLFERDARVGGTTAWSGGMVWIPNHPHMPGIGAADSREQALTYLHSLSHGMLIDELVESLVDNGPEMVAWFEDTTCVRFQAVPDWPDYHPEHPGGLPRGGRALECPLFAFDQLGEWADRVTRGYQISGTTMMSESSMARNRPKVVSRPRSWSGGPCTTSGAPGRRWPGRCSRRASMSVSSRSRSAGPCRW